MSLPPGTEQLIARAMEEDLRDGDVTSEATVPAETPAKAHIKQKAPGVIAGLDVALEVFKVVDPNLEVTIECEQGIWRENGPVLKAYGSARSLLLAERTALNFMGRLSGVATLTRQFVDEIKGTHAVMLDTRKTTPGMRLLEKQAVLTGGGANHRIGLYDQILIKENHHAMAGGVANAVRAAHALRPELPLEVEVRDQAELAEAVTVFEELGIAKPLDQDPKPDDHRIMLDNMNLEELRTSVAFTKGRVPLEASGNVNLQTVRAIAETGVDFISCGALTHSAPVLDLSLILEPQPR